MSESSHWYDKDGQPKHLMPYAKSNKAKAGMFRNTTLGDARKLNLAPSVSGITKMLPAFGLTKWITSQAVMSALTLKRLPKENDKDFMIRLAIDSSRIQDEARDHGKAIHANIDRFLRGKEIQGTIKIRGVEYYVLEPTRRFIEYWRENKFDLISCESTFRSDLGYGGTVDIIAKIGDHNYILDMKTKDTEEGKTVKGYTENCMQLVAYRDGVKLPRDTTLINIFISRNEPERDVQIHNWNGKDIADAELKFKACFEFWKVINNYNPS